MPGAVVGLRIQRQEQALPLSSKSRAVVLKQAKSLAEILKCDRAHFQKHWSITSVNGNQEEKQISRKDR